MDLINKFGEIVGNMSTVDAGRARKLLLLGYRLQEMRYRFSRINSCRNPDNIQHES